MRLLTLKGRTKYAVGAVGALGSLILFKGQLSQYMFRSSPEEKPVDHAAQPKVSQLKFDLPEKIPYLLVGGGTASHSAMRAIRGHDPKAKVLIITDEDRNPYMRPALSKELWFSDQNLRHNLNFRWWNGKERSIFYEIDEFFIPIEKLSDRENGGVSLIKKIRLAKLDPEKKVAHLENGQSIGYDKCLLAPGGKPKTLPQLESVSPDVKERIVYFRTADDFLRLEKIAETAKTIVVIGGGFLGSELTCALAKRPYTEPIPRGQRIIQIYPEEGNLGKILPDYLSKWVSDKVKAEGAQLIPNTEVKSARMNQDKTVKLELSNGDTIDVDYIVCAVGLEPDTGLAKASALEIDDRTGGYLVNSELEARHDVWVAGDASCFYDIKLGRRRVEHHDHAIHSGRLAGQNMVGAGKAYTHQSMFWSDLGSDISFEAVGIIDSSLPTVATFAEPEPEKEKEREKDESINDKTPVDQSASDEDSKEGEQSRRSMYTDKYGRGVVFYLKDDVIVGVLLWNLFSRLNTARRILNEQKKYDDFGEVAKLFNIYLDD